MKGHVCKVQQLRKLVRFKQIDSHRHRATPVVLNCARPGIEESFSSGLFPLKPITASKTAKSNLLQTLATSFNSIWNPDILNYFDIFSCKFLKRRVAVPLLLWQVHAEGRRRQGSCRPTQGCQASCQEATPRLHRRLPICARLPHCRGALCQVWTSKVS